MLMKTRGPEREEDVMVPGKKCQAWKVRVAVLKAATAKLSPEGHLHHKEQSQQEESFIFAEGTSQVCLPLSADTDVV